jgi:KUP system potassium uptake protein
MGAIGPALGALGVVYGDIGTSPLYALKECVHHLHGADHDSVLGILSLFFWSLTIVVTVKYLGFILKADSEGEGGIFALLALIRQAKKPLSSSLSKTVAVLSVVGAALLYGDGIITPAISVLSAVEGLAIVTPNATRIVVPLTCFILFILFLVQRRGTESIGQIFGPIMLAWFCSIGLLGVVGIVQQPAVLLAVLPWYAVKFVFVHRDVALLVLGSVVLCVTGGEALYADMGHFKRSAISRAWFWVVFPSLLLNYFGQGALLISRENVENPFYELVPRVLLVPLVVLATMATVIASQALISGAFSLTRQIVQFDFLPRVRVVHTSEHHEGQIYVPGVNWALAIACIATVLVARESTKLAGAYGLAVTADMVITSVLFFIVATRTWGKPIKRVAPIVGMFLFFDLAFFIANLLKLFDGGWFPLSIAALLTIGMLTWRDGRSELGNRFAAGRVPILEFLKTLEERPPVRVRGTAVFMTASSEGSPLVLQHHLKHSQVLHDQVVLLSIVFDDVPRVRSSHQIVVEKLSLGFFRLHVHCGFMETPFVPDFLRRARTYGLNVDADTTTYFLGRESFLARTSSTMALWRKQLFGAMARNAHSAVAYYGIPADRVIELGIQVEL